MRIFRLTVGEVFMKKVISALLISAAFLITTAFAAPQPLDKIVAIVNQGVITQSELSSATRNAKSQLPPTQANQISDEQLKQMVLKQLIQKKLLMQMAKRANITVTDRAVNKAISNIAKQNHITLKALKEKLTAHGLSFDQYKKDIKNQMIVHQVQMAAVGKTVQVTDADMQAALKKYKAQVAAQTRYHVLDVVLPNANKAQAQKMLSNWKKGHTPSNVTDLGWKTDAGLPTVFLNQLHSMKTGDIRGPIQAPNGLHLIKLAGVHGRLPMPNKKELQSMVYQMQLQKAAIKWMKNLRKSAYVKVLTH